MSGGLATANMGVRVYSVSTGVLLLLPYAN